MAAHFGFLLLRIDGLGTGFTFALGIGDGLTWASLSLLAEATALCRASSIKTDETTAAAVRMTSPIAAARTKNAMRSPPAAPAFRPPLSVRLTGSSAR